jgi:two-component system, cell cycle sensor histidine kinase and response regulator CckA
MSDGQLAAVSRLGVELAAAPPDSDLVALLVTRLREMTAAVAATYSAYHHDTGELELVYIATDGFLLDRLHQVLGRSLLGLRMPVTPAMHAQILERAVAHVPDIPTLSLGVIPGPVGAAIQRLFGIGDLVVLGFQREGRLIGTTTLLAHAGHPPVGDEVLTIFSNLVSAALLRRQVERELIASEKRFRAIFDSVNEAIILHDVETGGIVDVNRTTVEMFGFSQGELRDGGVGIISVGAPYGADEAVAKLRAAAAGEPQRFEWHCRRRDGGLFWGEVDVRRATLGDVNRLVVLVRDISRRKADEAERERLEQQFRQAQKMESIGRLAGGVAHDFNNLLTAMMGNITLAREDVAPGHPAQERLDEALRAGESAAGLTRQLLAFSRKQMIDPRVVQLNDVVRGVERLLQRLIGEHIELRTVTGAGLWPVRIDPGQFEQVLVNLAVNGRDAMPDGGRLTLATANAALDAEQCASRPWMTPGDFVSLTVTDTGSGMTDEVKTHLFEPFFTTKERGRGTGLGLAMVYGAVKQHGGSIEVESRLGRGTQVRIFLPALPAGTESVVVTPSERAGARGGGETILLVEDEAAVRHLAARVLQRRGYRVLACADAGEAVAAATERDGQIDLLLTDVVMPGMNGRVLAERLREVWPGLKVLLTSGYSEEMAERRALPAGDTDFIAKPYSTEALARRVREILDRT